MRASSLLLPLLPGAWAQLDSLAKAAGMTYFGTAVDNPSLNDTAYTAILSNTSEFGALTPLNGQKWNAIEPSQGNFTYGLGDAITNLAGKNNQLVRCQVLLYNNQLPDWVANGNWTNSTLVSAMQNHISNQVGHYKGQCYAWDVVKEAFLDDGSYRSDIFYNVIGEWYIPIAFQAAASADPDAKLYYNDYGIETPGPKTTAVQNLVKTLQAAGTKIDGVGFQSHFIVGSTPSKDDQISNLKSFADMGIDVALTELDVRMVLPSTSDMLNQQSQDYQSSIAACVVVVGCVGVTVWDFDDKYSWVPAAFTGFGAADLFDENLNRKPAYQGAVAALLSSNSSSSGNGTYNYIASNGTTITASLVNPTAPPYPTGSGSGAGAGNAANRAGNGTVTTASAPLVPTASISAATRDSWPMASWGGMLVVVLGASLF